MTKICAAVGLAVGLATTLHAQTRVEYQVSLAGTENWQSSLNVAPGTTVDIRARVSYMGTSPALGLGSVIFQPTISNWLPLSDYVPTFPSVGVADVPGLYGRINPYARGNDTDGYIGHLNTVSGTTYMRIARPQVTSWFGGSGNTSGGSGVLVGQVNRDTEFRSSHSPPFSGAIQDVVVFKFMIILGSTTDFRSLIVDTPTEGFGNRQPSGIRAGHWFADYTEPTGSIREAAFAVPATINVVPTPASLALLGLAALTAHRRRRPT